MISMILLVQHLVEATNEDGALPPVTGGLSITPIELPHRTGIPTYRATERKAELIH